MRMVTDGRIKETSLYVFLAIGFLRMYDEATTLPNIIEQMESLFGKRYALQTVKNNIHRLRAKNKIIYVGLHNPDIPYRIDDAALEEWVMLWNFYENVRKPLK